MTARARVRRADRLGEIGPRHPEAMVATLVHLHVDPTRHVTCDATRSRGPRWVVMVRGPGEDLGAMTGGADAFGGRDLQTVWIVAVAADDAGRVHFALKEGAPHVDLVLDLAVRVVEALLEQRGSVAIQEGGRRTDLGRDPCPSRVAGRADLDFRPVTAGRMPRGDRRSRREAPLVLLAECELQTGVLERLATAALRPPHVARPPSMTGLAGDVDLGPAGPVSMGGGVEAGLHIGRVTVRTHRPPASGETGPVEEITRWDRRLRVQMEPPLAAPCGGSAVPGHRQRLQPAVCGRHEVLLQGRDTEGVGHLEVAGRAVRSGRTDQEAVPASVEEEALTGRLQENIGEVAEHGLGVGGLHRAVVIGALPPGGLRGVTVDAGGSPHIGEPIGRRLAADPGRRWIRALSAGHPEGEQR